MPDNADQIRDLAKKLSSWFTASPNEVVSWLQDLVGREITKPLLLETRVGITVNRLAKTHKDDEVQKIAKQLVKTWKESVNQSPAPSPKAPPDSANQASSKLAEKSVTLESDGKEKDNDISATKEVQQPNDAKEAPADTKMVSVDLQDSGSEAPSSGSKGPTQTSERQRMADVASEVPTEQPPDRPAEGDKPSSPAHDNEDLPDRSRKEVAEDKPSVSKEGLNSSRDTQDTSRDRKESETNEDGKENLSNSRDKGSSDKDGQKDKSVAKEEAASADQKVANDKAGPEKKPKVCNDKDGLGTKSKVTNDKDGLDKKSKGTNDKDGPEKKRNDTNDKDGVKKKPKVANDKDGLETKPTEKAKGREKDKASTDKDNRVIKRVLKMPEEKETPNTEKDGPGEVKRRKLGAKNSLDAPPIVRPVDVELAMDLEKWSGGRWKEPPSEALRKEVLKVVEGEDSSTADDSDKSSRSKKEKSKKKRRRSKDEKKKDDDDGKKRRKKKNHKKSDDESKADQKKRRKRKRSSKKSPERAPSSSPPPPPPPPVSPFEGLRSEIPALLILRVVCFFSRCIMFIAPLLTSTGPLESSSSRSLSAVRYDPSVCTYLLYTSCSC
eukprot:gnl/MRDRNA2_/MRDRNA2_44395_c0_seq1.p1 gnl/MRDRNA2_/MRDRNA2_44395_c0~~gnl/MRDRNA2_/MRDRNA2_44395_c0_seq1.p1  ORF type:complete len:608 (-),score=165.64 gnl/MRDRNA2_/MRDRNA2_44395_c0_seq1:345-2168(-)